MDQYIGFLDTHGLPLNPTFWPQSTKDDFLMYYTKAGQIDKVVELADAGATLDKYIRIKVGSDSKRTPLQQAATYGHAGVVKFLLKRGKYTTLDKKGIIHDMCHVISGVPDLSKATRLRIIEHILDSGLPILKAIKVFRKAVWEQSDGLYIDDMRNFLRGYAQQHTPEILQDRQSALTSFLTYF